MSDSTTSKPRTRLFLSYGRRDAAALANRLREDLEKLGYEVWQDSRQIRAGKEWELEIEDGLRNTQVVIALLSPHAVRRSTDPKNPDNVDSVCLDELTFARFATPPTPIVPVMAIPCEPPFQVFRLDYVAMTQWMQSEDQYRFGLERMVAGIEAAIRGEPLPFRRWHHCLPVLDFAAQLHEKRQDFVGRQWLFDEIDAWRVGSTRERALLIVGDPGIGKSAFVAEMIDRNPDGRVLAYHICRADEPETLRSSTFVISLAGMIAGRLPAFADLLEAPQFQELLDPSKASSRPAHVFDQGLIAGLHQLPAPPDGIRYLLIDALDEALILGEGQPNIVTLLSTRLDRLPAWLRIVATTRREPEVLNRLSGLRAASLDAHRQDNLDDIDHFIEARLQTPNLAERLAASRVPLAIVQQKLREKGDGNFLYVSQALQDIERDNYSFGRLEELPHGLNQWYEAWFARKFSNPKREYVDARKVLEVILATFDPPDIRLIAEATGIDQDYDLPQTMQSLSNILPCVHLESGHQDTSVFRVANGPDQYTPEIKRETTVHDRYVLYHKSIRDWLPSNSTSYRVSVPAGHRRMIDYCRRKIAELRASDDDAIRKRSPDIGQPQSNLAYPYALKLDLHLAAIQDWDAYLTLFDDDWYLQHRYPIAYNYFPLNYVPDDWTAQLPSSAYSMPTSFQLNLCVMMSKRFENLSLKQIQDCRLDLFPDGGKYADQLRQADPEGFITFRDGCYTYVLLCLPSDRLSRTSVQNRGKQM